MDYKELAKRLPADYRKEILSMNLINKAQPNEGNPAMNYLFQAYSIYIDPAAQLNITCGSCLSDILNKWKVLSPVLLSLERESNLIKSKK